MRGVRTAVQLIGGVEVPAHRVQEVGLLALSLSLVLSECTILVAT